MAARDRRRGGGVMSASEASPPPGGSGARRSRKSRREDSAGRRDVRPPAAVPFTPAPVDRAAATAWVTEQARQLAPGAVDEALGYALDNLINAQADQWVAQVQSEFA